jgi:hypothetical protein
MNWAKYLVKLPLVISGVSSIVSLVKGASEDEKKEAIKAAVLSSVSLAEYATEKDLLNDASIAKLFSAVVEAELAVVKAREALKQGILTKK